MVQVGDKRSGLKSASLAVDGRVAQRLGEDQSQFTYVPSGGWDAGAHSFRVSATDKAGNVTSKDGSFTVAAPPAPVYAPDCIGRPRYKPASIILACADANAYVSNVHWTKWTSGSATGVGVFHWNDCNPYCAAGHFHARAGATLKLSAVARCKSKGFLEFTRLRFTPPRSAGEKPSTWRLSCTYR